MSQEDKAKLQVLALQIEAKASEAQTAINQVEAAHPSVFVSGWRPAVGWICALSLGYHYIVRHLVQYIAGVVCTIGQWPQPPPLPAPDLGDLIVILLGMLGFGTLRTAEKLKGVDRS